MSVPPIRTVSRRSRLPGAVIGITIFLVFQALGLIALVVIPFFFGAWVLSGWPWLDAQLAVLYSTGDTVRGLIVVQGLLALSSAVGLLRRRQGAWVLAMAVQGLNMLIALILYFSSKPSYVHPIMAYSVFMVLYLNYSAVADAFPRKQDPQDKGEAR